MKQRRASVLVGLLWCMALLSLVVVGVLHSATMELRIVHNYGDQIQAHYLALAGIEKTKALLYNDAASRRRSARNHSGDLYDSARDFKDIHFGRGQWSVLRQGRKEDGGGLIYGVSDEESRLNLNQASQDELKKLEGMTPDIAAAIIDWRDSDNQVTPGGAEADYYASLQPPYMIRNGPFQTVRELLMVRGVTKELFAGEDANMNGLLDPEEDDGKASPPADNQDGILDSGWSGLLTVNSSVRNVNAAGQTRVNIQSADENSLTSVPGITSDIARAIVAYRNQNRFETILDLLNVTAANPNNPAANVAPGNRGPGGQGGQPSPGGQAPQASAGGPTIISEQLLSDIADDITTADGQEQAGVVNVNTASAEVLACLPGMNPQLAQAIISYRQSAGFLANVAVLLKVPGITRDLLKQLLPRISVRSETFRILAEGQMPGTGTRKRIQVTVRLTGDDVETLSWREDL